MFCPKCGKADQHPETYCRQCGNYLIDFNKPTKRRHTPEEHIKVNTVLSVMTAITSITLSILLYSFFLGREDTPIIIYVTAGFLIAIFGWQVQTIWRTILLKKHFKKLKVEAGNQSENADEPIHPEGATTQGLLNEADLYNNIPASIIENTTRKLKVKK